MIQKRTCAQNYDKAFLLPQKSVYQLFGKKISSCTCVALIQPSSRNDGELVTLGSIF